MTLYAGETAQIRVEAADFDAETPLTDDDIGSMVVVVYDAAGVEVLETDMAYDEDEEAWIYAWNTAGAEPGGYRAKVAALGLEATPQTLALEFKRFRLARRPVGP